MIQISSFPMSIGKKGVHKELVSSNLKRSICFNDNEDPKIIPPIKRTSIEGIMALEAEVNSKQKPESSQSESAPEKKKRNSSWH